VWADPAALDAVHGNEGVPADLATLHSLLRHAA
jgi:hypothetical protein